MFFFFKCECPNLYRHLCFCILGMFYSAFAFKWFQSFQFAAFCLLSVPLVKRRGLQHPPWCSLARSLMLAPRPRPPPLPREPQAGRECWFLTQCPVLRPHLPAPWTSRKKSGPLPAGRPEGLLCHTKQALVGWTQIQQKFAERVGASEQK